MTHAAYVEVRGSATLPLGPSEPLVPSPSAFRPITTVPAKDRVDLVGPTGGTGKEFRPRDVEVLLRGCRRVGPASFRFWRLDGGIPVLVDEREVAATQMLLDPLYVVRVDGGVVCVTAVFDSGPDFSAGAVEVRAV